MFEKVVVEIYPGWSSDVNWKAAEEDELKNKDQTKVAQLNSFPSEDGW